jgi:hypothetical protein
MLQPARPIASAHLLNKEGILAATNPRAVRWAGKFHRAARYPGCLGEIFLANAEVLKKHQNKTPILALSHKKLHDVLLTVQFLLCREYPMPTHTVMAQGGLFSGIYVYRDWIPDFFKRWPLRVLSLWFSRRMGAALARFFRAMDCNPVYRRFRDVPSRRVYDSNRFAGRQLSGLSYDEFMVFTRNETESSIETVTRHITEENRQLIVFPEGKYQHSGEISRLNRFLMKIAGDSGHPVMTVSFSYDELCPDAWGRIDACMSAAIVGPDKRAALTAKTAEALQKNTVIMASPLIAIILLGKTKLTRGQFALRMHEIASQAAAAGWLVDPRLESHDFCKERLDRFLKRRSLARIASGKIEVNAKTLRRFKRSERTVNDLLWNKNNVKHAWASLGVTESVTSL